MNNKTVQVAFRLFLTLQCPSQNLLEQIGVYLNTAQEQTISAAELKIKILLKSITLFLLQFIFILETNFFYSTVAGDLQSRDALYGLQPVVKGEGVPVDPHLEVRRAAFDVEAEVLVLFEREVWNIPLLGPPHTPTPDVPHYNLVLKTRVDVKGDGIIWGCSPLQIERDSVRIR